MLLRVQEKVHFPIKAEQSESHPLSSSAHSRWRHTCCAVAMPIRRKTAIKSGKDLVIDRLNIMFVINKYIFHSPIILLNQRNIFL